MANALSLISLRLPGFSVKAAGLLAILISLLMVVITPEVLGASVAPVPVGS